MGLRFFCCTVIKTNNHVRKFAKMISSKARSLSEAQHAGVIAWVDLARRFELPRGSTRARSYVGFGISRPIANNFGYEKTLCYARGNLHVHEIFLRVATLIDRPTVKPQSVCPCCKWYCAVDYCNAHWSDRRRSQQTSCSVWSSLLPVSLTTLGSSMAACRGYCMTNSIGLMSPTEYNSSSPC